MTDNSQVPNYKKLEDPSIKQAAESFGERIYIDPELLNRFKALNNERVKLSISALDSLREIFNVSRINLFLDEEKGSYSVSGVKRQGNTLIGTQIRTQASTRKTSREFSNNSRLHYTDTIEINIQVNADYFTNLFADSDRNINYRKINNPRDFVEIFNDILQNGIKIEGLKFNTLDFFSERYQVETVSAAMNYVLIAIGIFAIFDNNLLQAVIHLGFAFLSSRIKKYYYNSSGLNEIRKDNTFVSPFGPSPDILIRSFILLLEDLKIVYFKEG